MRYASEDFLELDIHELAKNNNIFLNTLREGKNYWFLDRYIYYNVTIFIEKYFEDPQFDEIAFIDRQLERGYGEFQKIKI